LYQMGLASQFQNMMLLFQKLKVKQLKLIPSCLRQRAQFLNVCCDVNEFFICSDFKSTSCINVFNLIVIFRRQCVIEKKCLIREICEYGYSLFCKISMFCNCKGWPLFFSFKIVGNQCCDAVRIEPEFLDSSGKAFWKLRSCNDEYAFLLQGNSQNKLA
jgi:hypothetical protein